MRSRAIDSSLRRLGVEKLKPEDIFRMQWEDLEGKISGWIKQLKVAVSITLEKENTLLFFRLGNLMLKFGQTVFGQKALIWRDGLGMNELLLS